MWHWFGCVDPLTDGRSHIVQCRVQIGILFCQATFGRLGLQGLETRVHGQRQLPARRHHMIADFGGLPKKQERI